VRTDPKPDEIVALSNAQSAVAQRNPGREDGTRGMNLLVLKAGMPGVVLENPIRTTGALLHPRGKRIEGGTKAGGGM